MDITISADVYLQSITMERYDELYQLMERIYPDAYKYLWTDNGEWYIKYLYSRVSVSRDILEEGSDFYFVIYKNEIKGILKLQYNEPCPDLMEKDALRLHRIYLAPEIHGKGISNLLMSHVIKLAKSQKKDIIWLDCMDSKQQALNYYTKYGFQKGTLFELEYELLIDGKRGIYIMWKELN